MTEINKNITTIELIADKERITLSELAKRIGAKPQNMYDIRSGKVRSVSAQLADKILSVYPKYSRTWIITGDGSMYNDLETIENATTLNNQVGNGNQFNSSRTVERILDELAAQREITRETQKQLDKSQQQIDRLISIIETIKN